MKSYTIAVASGKGGTGKTTLSVALAKAFSKKHSASLLDCDVEEPNCRLFMEEVELETNDASMISYKFDNPRCSGCGKCAEACRFNAIAILHHKPLFYPELCHACGGCILACPSMAITEIERVNGKYHSSKDVNPALSFGLLNVGEAMAAPLIRNVKKSAPEAEITIIDSPPGTTCAMLSAVQDVDLTVLVTEPTPFGLNDLSLAVEALELFSQDFVIVTNRDGVGDDRITSFCSNNRYDHVASIPYSRTVAELCSEGKNPYGEVDSFTEQVDQIAELLERRLES